MPHHLAATPIYDLIAIALGATLAGPATATSRVTRAARLKAIKADILENLDDELTITAIPLRHGVTPRYIQMLFKMEGVTFSEFVLDQRLMRAFDMISDARSTGLNITNIAFAAGFGDLSYFNRTFRRRFGTTPSELRKAVYRNEGYVVRKQLTGTNSRASPFGKSLSILTSICRVAKRAILGQEISSHYFQECRQTVRRDFWPKLKRLVGQVPFVEHFVTAYYCGMDKAVPMRVRAMLLAALAYFIVPFDLIPDATPAFGLTDDATLLATVIGRFSSHITPVHRAAAARTLRKKLLSTR